jgi:hypothetical protein
VRASLKILGLLSPCRQSGGWAYRLGRLGAGWRKGGGERLAMPAATAADYSRRRSGPPRLPDPQDARASPSRTFSQSGGDPNSCRAPLAPEAHPLTCLIPEPLCLELSAPGLNGQSEPGLVGTCAAASAVAARETTDSGLGPSSLPTNDDPLLICSCPPPSRSLFSYRWLLPLKWPPSARAPSRTRRATWPRRRRSASSPARSRACASTRPLAPADFVS